MADDYLIVVEFRRVCEHGDAKDEHVVGHDVGQLLSSRLSTSGAVQGFNTLASFSDVLKNGKLLSFWGHLLLLVKSDVLKPMFIV
jgi:hypothetical protein